MELLSLFTVILAFVTASMVRTKSILIVGYKKLASKCLLSIQSFVNSNHCYTKHLHLLSWRAHFMDSQDFRNKAMSERMMLGGGRKAKEDFFVRVNLHEEGDSEVEERFATFFCYFVFFLFNQNLSHRVIDYLFLRQSGSIPILSLG